MVSVKLVKALDPTRPVLLPWRPEEWLPKEVDILLLIIGTRRNMTGLPDIPDVLLFRLNTHMLMAMMRLEGWKHVGRH